MITIVLIIIAVLVVIHILRDDDHSKVTNKHPLNEVWYETTQMFEAEGIEYTKDFSEWLRGYEYRKKYGDTPADRLRTRLLKYKDLKPIVGSKNDPYYVYSYTINGEVKYIGKGTTVQYPESENEFFIENGYENIAKFIRYQRAAHLIGHKYVWEYLQADKNRKIDIKILKTFKDEQEALAYESDLIFKQYNELLNRDF